MAQTQIEVLKTFVWVFYFKGFMNIGYEYKVINRQGEINVIRGYTNRKDSDEVILHELLNGLGAEGWRAINPQDSVIYFERILDQAKKKPAISAKAL